MAINPHDPAVDDTPSHPPGVLVSEYYTKPYGYSCARASGTRDWLILYTISGNGFVRQGTDYISCASGDMILIPPDVPHHYFTAENSTWKLVWAHFHPRIGWLDWIRPLKTGTPVIHIQTCQPELQEAILAAFGRLVRYSQDMLHLYREELALNALEEIILLVSNHSPESDDAKLDPRVKQVLHILSQHYQQELQIGGLARQVCLSPSRLAHLFKDQVGKSIVDMLLFIRVKQAEKRLRFTARSIAEIASEVGFHSADYFTRQFTKYCGMSPSMYRKQQGQV